MKVTSGTIARTICLIIALLNQALAITDKTPIPFVEEDIYQLVSLLFTMIASTVAWWKNNSFSKSAIEADALLNELKTNK